MNTKHESPFKYLKDIILSVRDLDKISIAGFLVLAQLFILLSAPYLWENQQMQDMFTTYFIMMAFTFAVLDNKNPFYKITMFDGLTQMLLAFVTGIYLFSFFGFQPIGDYAGFESLTLLIIAQALVIGTVEESMFRGAIPAALDKGKMSSSASRFVAATAFAGFHYWAYNGDIPSMIAAFLFGLLMQFFWDGGSVKSKTKGYPLVSCGLHAAWNVTVIAGSFCIIGGN